MELLVVSVVLVGIFVVAIADVELREFIVTKL